MTVKEPQQYFKEHLVPKNLYKLDGNHRGRICMEHKGDSWNVYFSDRREKVGLLRFASESEACAAMKRQIEKLMEAVYGIAFVAHA